MANPLVANLKSLLMTEDTATAPAEGTPRQVTGTATQTVITSVDLSNAVNDSYVLHVFEALNGDCKGQKVLGRSHDNAGNVTVTAFKTACTTTEFKHWTYSWPTAVPTGDGSTTTVVAAQRTEADDYWNAYYMLSIAGENTALRNITDFANATGTFTTAAFTTATDIGDACLPVQPLQPDSVEISIDGGTAIEREIITDSLDPEGIVVGAIESATVAFSSEIRGIATAAGDGVAATPPAEMHVALSTVFTQTLDTGDAVTSGSSTSKVVVDTSGAQFTQYGLAMVNGDAFAINSISTDDLNAPTGHLSQAAVSGDICYASAHYKPKDASWKSCSFLAWYGDALLLALTGGMPEISATVEGNAIAHYDCSYSCVGGFMADVTKPHDDIYDTSTPVVGKANVSRVVYDGAELAGDVLSCSFTFLDAPMKKGAAFGAYENNGGHIYTSRTGSCSMVVQMEDSSYCQQYRALDEVDLLVQVGSVPTAAWACWAPRCQLVSNPEISEADGLFQITLELRFLRPTTAGQPAYVLGHF